MQAPSSFLYRLCSQCLSLSYLMGLLLLQIISGYSTLKNPESTDSQNKDLVEIIGGIAGSDADCVGTQTCDNCTEAPLACNATRIYDKTNLLLTISSDTAERKNIYKE